MPRSSSASKRSISKQGSKDTIDIFSLRVEASNDGGFGSDERRREIWPLLLSKVGWEAAKASTDTLVNGVQLKMEKEDSDVDGSSDGKKVEVESDKKDSLELVPGRRIEEEEIQKEELEVDEMDFLDVESLDPHPDEHQIILDVRRSFVTFPRGLSRKEKETLQNNLNTLLVALFRRNRSLHYFQGLHDILSILILVFLSSPSLPISSTTTISERNVIYHTSLFLLLHRLRDSLTTTLAPTLGYLRLILSIISLENHKLGEKLKELGDVPYFTLSWVLTLLSHDLEDEEMVKCTFDFLLVNDPAMVLYLGSAIILVKQDQLKREEAEKKKIEEGGEIENEDEEEEDLAMLHAQMSKLPVFSSSSTPAQTKIVPSSPATISSETVDGASTEKILETMTGQENIKEKLDESLTKDEPPPYISIQDHQDQKGENPPLASSTPIASIQEPLSTVFKLALQLSIRHPLFPLVKEVMDVNSVLLTWPTDSVLKSNEEALSIINSGNGIVKPYPPPSPSSPEKGKSRRSEEWGMGSVLLGVAVGAVLVGVYVAMERPGAGGGMGKRVSGMWSVVGPAVLEVGREVGRGWEQVWMW